MPRHYATPMFQHRHYVALAQWAHESNVSKDALDKLADIFARDNGSFDRYRFLTAASGEPSNWRDR